MNEQGHKFAWQEGYGAFTVSLSDTATVAKYIRNLEEHHRTVTFEEEYMRLLRENGIDFDSERLFD
jgi:putative transposase